jgi:hypothetical protein
MEEDAREARHKRRAMAPLIMEMAENLLPHKAIACSASTDACRTMPQ